MKRSKPLVNMFCALGVPSVEKRLCAAWVIPCGGISAGAQSISCAFLPIRTERRLVVGLLPGRKAIGAILLLPKPGGHLEMRPVTMRIGRVATPTIDLSHWATPCNHIPTNHRITAGAAGASLCSSILTDTTDSHARWLRIEGVLPSLPSSGGGLAAAKPLKALARRRGLCLMVFADTSGIMATWFRIHGHFVRNREWSTLHRDWERAMSQQWFLSFSCPLHAKLAGKSSSQT